MKDGDFHFMSSNIRILDQGSDKNLNLGLGHIFGHQSGFWKRLMLYLINDCILGSDVGCRKNQNLKLEMTQDESKVLNSSWDQIVDGKKSAGELLSQEEKLKVFWLFVLARHDFSFKIMQPLANRLVTACKPIGNCLHTAMHCHTQQ